MISNSQPVARLNEYTTKTVNAWMVVLKMLSDEGDWQASMKRLQVHMTFTNSGCTVVAAYISPKINECSQGFFFVHQCGFTM